MVFERWGFMLEDKEKKIFSQNLNFYMNKFGKSQADIVSDLGINKSTISTWCKGVKMPRMGTIQVLAEYFGVKKADLVEEKDSFDNDIDLATISGIKMIHHKKYQMLGSIACGAPSYATEDFAESVELCSDVDADFVLVAKGDSMINARIGDGDYVFIKAQPDVRNGQIAAVIIGEEATLKRIYKKQDYIMLQAENPKYEPIIITKDNAENVRIIGRAIAFQSNVF